MRDEGLPRLCSTMLARATARAQRALGGATGAWSCVGVGRVGFTAASAVRLPTEWSTHSVCEHMGVAATASVSLRRAHGAVRIPGVAWPAQPSRACGAASVGTALGKALGARPDVTMLDAFNTRGQIRTATFGAHSLPLPNPTHGLPFGHVSHFPKFISLFSFSFAGAESPTLTCSASFLLHAAPQAVSISRATGNERGSMGFCQESRQE